MSSSHPVLEEVTTPYKDQKPGTSGLRKKVAVFKEKNYLMNFVQSLFNAIPESDYVGQTLLVSGDGRYWCREAVHIIAEVAAGNGVARLWVGKNGWVSTPAGSAIIREREGGICTGGLLLTASHNPGGPTEDFGVKYNCANGGPAPEHVTDAIYEESLKVTTIKRVTLTPVDLSKLGPVQCTDKFTIEVIDPVEDWLRKMKTIFDFDLLRSLVKRSDFRFVYDGLNGIAGPYAKAIFVQELGCNADEVLRQCEPLEDFGGHHPDPNLTYAKRLVDEMKVDEMKVGGSTPVPDTGAGPVVPDFGAAGDGDNDRNMILGKRWFVTPSDSVAIIAHYAQRAIPYFSNGLKGVARSMPTSEALLQVAKKLGVEQYEVPTGWKFFGNLMDADRCSICGEESFGTGSDHIREKDGLWAVLCWMSILAFRAKQDGKLISVQQINEEFWSEYGRNFYVRYDYENMATEDAAGLMNHLACLDVLQYNAELGTNLTKADIFTYHDLVDGSVTKNQGARIFYEDGSRFVVRLSGTGSSGATVRMYFEQFSKDYLNNNMQSFIDKALLIARVKEFLKTDVPTVKT
ncbi:cytoplasmic phosphoglucomutase [Gregarina niphandrodes]|uniref:phosphoglucomutase (alpha-D-glucose-1,6-bisphosphate-dependent) n=1 Tax=Gregarina niphandrodes TaxID=110365 RepID=A0A023B3G6_GRENI|nr:cytoplasmic phosphoglucomutase [Gregarina niphandrodes]EZG55515.1 cytoplasmic phosphoglucomutase [Gregarina niphandrodes]|eukprot:XP_011131501.1 cytoplasmic phosphoglucomutase [Gregarina niphandrodes]